MVKYTYTWLMNPCLLDRIQRAITPIVLGYSSLSMGYILGV
jgi:hypothetical protein